MLTGKAIARTLWRDFLVELVLEETLIQPFIMINKNSSNTEAEGNNKLIEISKMSYMIRLK